MNAHRANIMIVRLGWIAHVVEWVYCEFKMDPGEPWTIIQPFSFLEKKFHAKTQMA
jgi:hypothetical protein